MQQPEHTEQLFCGFIFVSPRGWKLLEGTINAFKDVRAEFECYYCTQIQHVQQFPVMPEVRGRAQDVTLRIPQVRFCAESMLDAVQTVQTAWGVVTPSKYIFYLKEARQQALEWECGHPQEAHRGYHLEVVPILAAQGEPELRDMAGNTQIITACDCSVLVIFQPFSLDQMEPSCGCSLCLRCARSAVQHQSVSCRQHNKPGI